LNIGKRRDEFEVFGMGGREQITGGFGNVLAEVKSSVVPREGELVTPDTWSLISNSQDVA
jgi:hypothetical protein